MASQLASLLEIPSAHVEIGIYKGREGSMSFLINRANEDLIEGIWLINELYPNYSSERMFDDSINEYYSLEMLINSVEKYGLKKELLEMVIFDYLIGNSDRHQNNWAIISKGEREYGFSPLYDNSSSLCCYVPESEICDLLGNDKKRWNALVRTKSTSIIRIDKKNKKRPRHEELLIYVCDVFFDLVRDFLIRIRQGITDKNINEILSEYPNALLSPMRKQLIQRFLLDKAETIREILDRKEA